MSKKYTIIRNITKKPKKTVVVKRVTSKVTLVQPVITKTPAPRPLRHHGNPFGTMRMEVIDVLKSKLLPGSMWITTVPLRQDWLAGEGDECNVMPTKKHSGGTFASIGTPMIYIGERTVKRSAKLNGKNVTTTDIVYTFLLKDRIVVPSNLSYLQLLE